ncbi:alpha/beta hydrolase family protein [Agaribacterium sp. ZY112]|uniref:alpha/beta hydrolase family protein n=1 Tax=Agaribacterium sp. ZY112 TaxID=3233574 RepID=UPI003525A74D
MAVSQTGGVVAFRKRDRDIDRLHVVSTEKNTLIGAYDLSDIHPLEFWFLDENRLIILARDLRSRLDHSTAFVLDIKKSTIKQLLTRGDNIYSWQDGMGHVVGVSKDAKYVFMPAFTQTDSIRGNQKTRYSLMKVDLGDPDHPIVFDSGHKNAVDFFMNDQGELVARELYDSVNDLHELQVKRGKKWESIFKQRAAMIELGFIGLSNDEDSIVVVLQPENSEAEEYRLMSLIDGSLSGPLYKRDKSLIEDYYQTVNRKVIGLSYSGFLPTYEFFDSELQGRIEQILASFKGQNVRIMPSVDNTDHIIAYVSGVQSPGDYYLFSKDKKPRFLTTSRPAVDVKDIHPIVASNIKARDGLVIPVLLTVPRYKVDSLKNLPAIVMPHGGPESYDQIGFDWWAQAFANEGYAVLQPQFRGSSGFGHSFKIAGRGEWGGKMQEDISDALLAMIEQGIIDKNRVCIVGASYGGYAALAGGAFTPELYKCVVSFAGVSELNKMLKTERRDHGRYSSILNYWDRVIKDGGLDKTDLDKKSPANYAENFTSPILLIHGKDDDVVNIDQSKLMYKKLKKSKKNVEFIKLKGEGHYLNKADSRERFIIEALDFVNAAIGEP